MNTIALGVRQPNFLNTLVASEAGAQRVIDNDRQNQLARFLQENGSGIVSGDQNALNAYGAYDPSAAVNIQGAQLGQQATRQNMDVQLRTQARLDRAEEREVARYAQQLAAGEAAAQAAEMERMVSMGLAAQTPEQWDQITQGTELQGQFASREAIASRFLSVADALTRYDAKNAPAEEPTSVEALRIRAQEAGLMPGTPEYQEFMATGGKNDGMSLRTTPNGGIEFATGSAATGSGGQRLTERQSQIALFGNMMDVTAPAINALERGYNPANLGDAIADATGWLGNYFKSQEGQEYRTSAAAWAEGVLRLQTGAAATQPEIERVASTYFAVPGDTPQTVAHKRRLREAFLQSIVGASSGAFESNPRGLPDDPSASAQPQSGEMPPAPTNIEGITAENWPDVWSAMSEEDRALFK